MKVDNYGKVGTNENPAVVIQRRGRSSLGVVGGGANASYSTNGALGRCQFFVEELELLQHIRNGTQSIERLPFNPIMLSEPCKSVNTMS